MRLEGAPSRELSFVPVEVVTPVAAAPAARATAETVMEVVLENGLRVRVAPGFEEGALVRLVRALEGTC